MSFNNPNTISFRDLNLTRNLNTGSRLVEFRDFWQFNGEIYELKKIQRSVALLKVIDEVMTNALDASVGQGIEVFHKNGVITVKNYGKYISFDKVESAFSKENTSSNYGDDEKSVTGGLNGVGAKLTNVFSELFLVEVSSGDKLYKQKFSNNMANIDEPEIADYKGRAYVSITFKLTCDILCLSDLNTPQKNWLDENLQLFENLIIRRVHEMAVYTSDRVYYNGNLISIDFTTFVNRHKRFAGDKSTVFVSGNEYKIKLGIIVHEPVKTKTKYNPAGFNHVTIINGVVLEEKNNIYAVFIKKITDNIRERQEFKSYVSKDSKNGVFPGKYFQDNITIVIVGQYPRSEFEFKSQEKSSINFSKKALERFNKNFTLNDNFLGLVWKSISAIYPKIIVPKNKNAKIAKVPLNEQATCIMKRSQADNLFIIEGNSASTLIRKIISRCPSLGFDRNGFACLKGVPINPVKHTKFFEAGPLMDEKLANNEEIQSIVNHLKFKYGQESAGAYRNVVIATDQDYDGIGKICSLMICFFMIYFPHVVKQKRLYRYRTPIVRAVVNGTMRNYYSEQEFEMDRIKNPGIKGTYFKGLGTHEKDHIVGMVKNFNNDLILINYDQAGEVFMHHLYGQDTTMRKKLLLEFNEYALRRYDNDLSIGMEEHFKNESIPEQVNNILRMLPNVIDGLVPCGRKILAYLRSYARKKINVSSLGGMIKGKLNYNHAVESLENSIKLLAQSFEGANTFPLLLSVSDQNGNKHGGSKATTAARYTNVIYNTYSDLYYPIEDDSLLKLTEEEGVQYEPVNYVPIVPRILTENSKSVATGWNSNFAARDFKEILKYVRYSIDLYPNVICPSLLGYVQDCSKLIVHKGKEIGIGTYTFENNILHITDLPPRLTGTKIIKQINTLFKPEEVIINDHNDGENIDLKITILRKDFVVPPGKKTYLNSTTEYFGIYKIYNRNLNFYGHGRLREYLYISSIFKDWFKERQILYQKRIDKKLVFLKADWLIKECIYHFIQNDKGTIEGMKKNEQIAVLEKTDVVFTNGDIYKGYIKFNASGISMNIEGDAKMIYDAIYSKADYGYILNLRKKQTNIEYIEKYKNIVGEAYLAYTKYLETTWKDLWNKELDELEKAYDNGRSCKWNYKNIVPKKKRDN